MVSMSKNLHETAADLLRERGVKPSLQRLLVLSFLMSQKNHPSVEDIYKALLPKASTLSKTTVYNTLGILSAAGLVNVITIDGSEARYDIDTLLHGHFQCKQCNSIHDFQVDLPDASYKMLNGYCIEERNIYFKGICSKCLENTKNK